jgi:hypothetical protein
MVGNIEVDPGDDAIPCAAFEIHTMMSLAEHLHEFAGVGVIL